VLAPDLATWIAKIRASSFRIIPIEDQHLVAYATLPQVKDYRDPFDRLLIAQALSENLTLISRDGKFGDYVGLRQQWA
jgi:PIN domain nuclease of toxin-antitoxin system